MMTTPNTPATPNTPQELHYLMISRHLRGEFTEEEVINIARRRPFGVSKFRSKHRDLRQMTKRLRAEGKLELTAFDGRNFTYRSKI